MTRYRDWDGPIVGGYDTTFDKSIQERVNEAMLRVSAQREAIVEAFLAETGYLPSECEIVQVTEGTTIRWFVRKRVDE